MIDTLWYINSPGQDVYTNQAWEEYLFRQVRPGEIILYLWQNENTVVLGRNQNCWRECLVDELLHDGGHPARRLSGGGAVYHDTGNLNFTFCTAEQDHDVAKQLSVIVEALRSAGIAAEKSGRNDILAAGRKFSGNAFYRSGGRCFHHGTLMVDVDTERLGRYLKPSAAKLAAKSVASVRSRVVNLRELAPGLTVERLRGLLVESFSRVYGLPAQELTFDGDDLARIAEYREEFADWDWICGEKGSGDARLETRFPWGDISLELTLEKGYISEARVYSDAMEGDFIMDIAASLAGRRYAREELTAAVEEAAAAYEEAAPLAADICAWLDQVS